MHEEGWQPKTKDSTSTAPMFSKHTNGGRRNGTHTHTASATLLSRSHLWLLYCAKFHVRVFFTMWTSMSAAASRSIGHVSHKGSWNECVFAGAGCLPPVPAAALRRPWRTHGTVGCPSLCVSGVLCALTGTVVRVGVRVLASNARPAPAFHCPAQPPTLFPLLW